MRQAASVLKAVFNLLHAAMAKSPRSVSGAYIGLISAISRNVLPRPLADRAYNSILRAGHEWPEFDFKPRRVVFGRDTSVLVVPHIGEEDGHALFSKRIDDEPHVFDWLEKNACASYDSILEIGANVGFYAIFLDALIKRAPGARLKSIVAFEPSQLAFARLTENLRINRARFVETVQAAVGETSGMQSFFEPKGHLVNGSLVRDFSAAFSEDIAENIVAVVGAGELTRYMKPGTRTLIKIDVEGFEPELLAAMSSLITQSSPDLILEILPGAAEKIDAIPALRNYDRFLITANGPQKADKLFASPEYRDWLLTARAV